MKEKENDCTHALGEKPLQLFAVCIQKMRWDNVKTQTITQIIACSFCPPQFFSIMLSRSKTHSSHNQTSVTKEWTGLCAGIVVEVGLSVTKEWTGLCAGIVVEVGLRLTGPQGEIGGRPQKSSAASGTKNSGATYHTWLTMGYGKTPVKCVCVCVCVCVWVYAYVW